MFDVARHEIGLARTARRGATVGSRELSASAARYQSPELMRRLSLRRGATRTKSRAPAIFRRSTRRVSVRRPPIARAARGLSSLAVGVPGLDLLSPAGARALFRALPSVPGSPGVARRQTRAAQAEPERYAPRLAASPRAEQYSVPKSSTKLGPDTTRSDAECPRLTPVGRARSS